MLNILKKQKRKWHIILLFFFIPLLISQNLMAETGFRVFQTQQAAQNLIPILSPLYDQSVRFTANNNQLIVKAPENTLLEIEQLLQDIDQPLQNLLIEVSSSLDKEQDFQADSIGYNSNNSNIKLAQTRRRNSADYPNLYSIRTVSGQWSTIQTGKRVPYYNSSGRPFSPWQNSTELVNVTSGFDVFPILNNDKVMLKIRPYNSEMNAQYSNQINVRSLDTSITGTLGEWIFLGGAINELNSKNVNYNFKHNNNDSNIQRYSTQRNSDLETNYYIRVNKID